MADTWPDVAFDAVTFDEAIQWFEERVPMTDAIRAATRKAIAERAFYVAGVAQLDLVQDAYKALQRAIRNGSTLDDFKREVGPALVSAWGDSVEAPSWRLETIFRTNLQTAYAAGRYQRAIDPDVLDDRPFWMFDAILDKRITTVCKACDGTVLPADDPWWRTHSPPMHFNCRSSVMTLTEEEARGQRGFGKQPTAKAGNGFGVIPAIDDENVIVWADEQINDAPPSLGAIARERMDR